MAAADPAGPPPITTRSNALFMLPRNSCETEEVMGCDLNLGGCTFAKIPAHLFHGVSAPHRRRCVMARETAAIDRFARISQRKMRRMPSQIVDHDGVLRHPQSFIHEEHNLIRF